MLFLERLFRESIINRVEVFAVGGFWLARSQVGREVRAFRLEVVYLPRNIQATISSFWLAKNTSINSKPVQKVKLAVQNVKLTVQNGEIENDWHLRQFHTKSISDKQNGGQKWNKIVWLYSGAPAGAEGARGRSSIPIENGKSIKPRKFGGRPRPYVRTRGGRRLADFSRIFRVTIIAGNLTSHPVKNAQKCRAPRLRESSKIIFK